MNFPLLMMSSGQGPLGTWVPLVLMGVVLYFFMIRPQMKKAKEAKQLREGLKKGDKVITIGGLHGKITDVAETTFLIETEGGGRIRIERSAVATSPADQIGAAK